MHPHVKLHKLLQLVVSFFFISIMSIPVDAANCNGPLRSQKLYSDRPGGRVWITGSRIMANCKDQNETECVLQTITIGPDAMLLYDPHSSMFLCWNKSYTNLLGKRFPRDLSRCKFSEKPSLKNPTSKIRYVSYQSTSSGLVEHEIRFTPKGFFAQPRIVRRCLKNQQKKRPFYRDIDFMMSLNISAIRGHHSEEFQAYAYVSKHCADSDLLPTFVHTDCDLPNFCKTIFDKNKQRHGHRIHPLIKRMCSRHLNRY